jgi:multiple antibiotic resistance protein
MGTFAFIFTVCFVLMGPTKLMVPFANLTRGKPLAFRRSTAVWGSVIAIGVCLFVAVLGGTLVEKYQLSLPALQLSAGLVLLLSALHTMFPRADVSHSAPDDASPMQLAVSPLATPTIVSAAGIGALLILVMSAPRSSGMYQVLAISLGVIMALNFLVMYFNDRVLRAPGLLPGLKLLGGVLGIIQVALAIDTMLDAFRTLGVVTGS